ncbi:hypothetical protein ACOZE3_33265 [Streptomyces cinereoruber]
MNHRLLDEPAPRARAEALRLTGEDGLSQQPSKQLPAAGGAPGDGQAATL